MDLPPPSRAVPPVTQRMYRSRSDRAVSGVCGGIAEHLGVNSLLVRAVMLLAVLLGPGILVYAFLWVFTPLAPGGFTPNAPVRGRGPIVLAIAGAAIIVGALVVGPFASISGGVALPLLLVVAGAFLTWSQLDAGPDDDIPWTSRSGLSRAVFVGRPLAGLVLVIGGLLLIAGHNQSATELVRIGLSAGVVLLGAVVLLVPFAVRLWRRVNREHTARLIETERADIAAHLHDSVLQTLAMIQRRADDRQAVVTLARAQERELRQWLYGDAPSVDASLATALRVTCAEVEATHGIPIELVATGDQPTDEPGEALARATREALVNAVRHGAPPIAVYAEIGVDGVEVFVRDHGPGFDLDALAEVPEDRLGVRESVVGRMVRHGGSARYRRRDDGTEVQLRLPPRANHGPAPAGAPHSHEIGRPEPARPEAGRPEPAHQGETP